ncbi:MAG: hypothetical protein ABMB14_22720 [Myxococcota bacterium]
MVRWFAIGWLAVGCGGEKSLDKAGEGDDGGGVAYPTEVAVRNDAAAAVTVVLSAGGASESFADLGPGETSDYRTIDWSTYDGVTVEVTGEADGGTLDLLSGRKNLVSVVLGSPPAVQTPSPGGAGGSGR